MILKIEATKGRHVVVAVSDKKPAIIEPQSHQSLVLLPKIVAYLKKFDKELSDIKEIEVLLGEGSFTTTRQVVSLANTLRWLYGLKIVDTTNRREVKDFMIPKYYSEPSITLPSRKIV
jgi:tRNA A37 threonylcarbamoyladenosine modification protein TsaB